MNPDQRANQHDPARYRLGGTIFPIQARKAWEDQETWRAAVVLAFEGDVLEVTFLSADAPPAEDRPSPDSDQSAFPPGRRVWITERWRVLAYPDEQGNAIAVRQPDEMPGSVFQRAGGAQLHFVGAVRITGPAEDQ